MSIVTIQESDMANLKARFAHFEFIFEYFDSKEKLISYFVETMSSVYEISDFLGIAYDHIDGNPTLFMYGSGYTLARFFGDKRVYGK